MSLLTKDEERVRKFIFSKSRISSEFYFSQVEATRFGIMRAFSSRPEVHWILLCVFPDTLIYLTVYIIMHTIHYIHVVNSTKDLIIALNNKFLQYEYNIAVECL